MGKYDGSSSVNLIEKNGEQEGSHGSSKKK
jgi:hypothetical protein